jgi:Putative peptidoglycan binding domain
MTDLDPRTYRVRQLVHDAAGTRNEDVVNPEDLVTHHPTANRGAHMRDGVILGVEDLQPNYRRGDRSYAYIGSEYQEIIDSQVDAYRTLKPDQVLLVKDFILEDPQPARGVGNREVDVPSPVAGYISLVRAGGGMVEIMDHEGGDVIARVRHMSGITLTVGDTVEYGQRLGTQNNLGLGPNVGKHVHLEMDTGYYQQYENYISDLTNGRLPVQASFRDNVAPQPVVDDNVARLGETSERVRDTQRALITDGYRAVGNQPIVADGVYRLEMQGAVIAFQQDHGLLQTGDIDASTWQQAAHINRQAQAGPEALPQPNAAFLGPQILNEINPALAPEQVIGDPRYGLRPPSDPARTGRQPEWTEHEGHMLDRGVAAPAHQLQQPGAAQPADGPALIPAGPQMNGPGRHLEPDDRQRQEEQQDGPPQPHHRGAQLMTDPNHIANASWVQAECAMSRLEFDSNERLTPEQRERATAGVAAGVLADARTNMSRIDRVDASTLIEPQTGLPKYLIAGQGDPTTAHYKRVAVDLLDILNTSVERSSDVAKTATQTREQLQAQQLVQTQTQTMNQDSPSGPSMRIGARSIAMPGGEGSSA